MNRNRLIIGLAAAIVIAAAMSFFVYRQFKQASASVFKPIVMQHIVVASAPLQLGTRVDASNLRLIPWPSSEPVAGMFTRIEDCASRALITPVAPMSPSSKANWLRGNRALDCPPRFPKECGRSPSP